MKLTHIHSSSDDKIKPFQNNLLSRLSCDECAEWIYITDAHPLGTETFDILISDKGILCFQLIGLSDAEKFNLLIPRIPNLILGKYESIYSKLSTHRGLTYKENAAIHVKMPFVIKFVFTELFKNQIETLDTTSLQHCIFKGDERGIIDLMSQSDFDGISPYSYKKDFDIISVEEKNLVVLVMAPEYTNAIPNDNKFSKIEDAVSVKNSSDLIYNVKPGDVYANAFCLDPEQISIVNRITTGHWLIISPAGSGKSVLLLSTALRLAKNDNASKTIIVCRNRNLSNVYEWKIAQSGIRHRNIQCFNVYRLFQHILTLAEVSFDPKEFDINFEKALKVLESNRLDLAYTTIFIDEIQILREKYYKIFYYLIKNAKVVCLFGDIAQDINVNVINQTYPWEVSKHLNFGDNVIELDKNYRNTKNISEYATSLLELSKFYYEKLGIQKEVFDENFTAGKAFKDGIDPVVLRGDIQGEVREVVSIISNLKEKVSLSEVAVLFINRQNRKTGYYLFDTLRSELQSNKIPYTELISSENIIANKIGVEKGVVLATVESVLGLDFKVVILCGLSLLGVFDNSKSISTENPNIAEKSKIEFYKCCNILYIATTRARDELFILLTETQEQSVYSKILIQSLALKKRREALDRGSE